jgi:hypothetical protein
MNGQMALFAEPAVKTNAEAGLRETPPGAERLLAELVRRGLHPGGLRAAAALCLALDEGGGR